MNRSYQSQQVRQSIEIRHRAMAATRRFFLEQGFLEVDPPLLINANAVEAYIDPIRINGPTPQYLQTSPELYLKRLLSHGLERIYSLGHVFRSGESGKKHLPEFSLLEWYRTGGTLKDLISDCETLFTLIATEVAPVMEGVQAIKKPFDLYKMQDLWLSLARIDLRTVLQQIKQGNPDALLVAAQKAGYWLRPGANFDDVFHHIMMVAIEPKIGQDRPAAVSEWPTQLAALAQVCPGDPLFADRFEIYANGLELANAFQELTDADEQKRRFQADQKLRRSLGKDPLPIDHAFLADLRHMPGSAGIAVGFDRLLQLICNKPTIQEIYPVF